MSEEKKNDGGPAFVEWIQSAILHHVEPTPSFLIDYFAAAALQGIRSADSGLGVPVRSSEAVATQAFSDAAAMLKEHSKRTLRKTSKDRV